MNAPSLSFSARLLEGLDDPMLRATEGTSENVFQNSEFLAGIRRHMLSGSEQLLLVGVADATGDPVAVFPFVKRRKLGISFIEAVDFGIVDYFAPSYFRDTPLSAEETAKVWKAVVRAVPGVHAVAFKKLPRELHGRPHALSGADFLKPMGADATTLRMRGSDRPPLNTEKMSLAKEVRRKSKKLEKIGTLAFAEARSNAEVDAAMATLVEFRTARFAELGRHDALLDEKVVAFYRALADRRTEKPLGRLFTLRAGEHPVAIIYGFACADIFTLIVPAITTCKETQSGSPGLVALFKTLQWCGEREFTVFDLSVGSLSYKARFDAETVELFEYQQALSPLGLPVVAEAALRRRLRHLSLKYPELRKMLEKLARIGQRSRREGEDDTSSEERSQRMEQWGGAEPRLSRGKVTAHSGN